MSQNIQARERNNSFFNGYYKEIWRHIFPEKTTLAEVDFMFAEANLKKNDAVLDIMCGYGRHSIEFAKRGIDVTATDNLQDYIDEIRLKSSTEEINIDAVCVDVLDMQFDKQFEAALCMGNSMQFFSEEDTIRLLANISSHLKEQGKLFINTWSIMEIVSKQFKEKSWGRFNDLLYFTESKFLISPSRIETHSIIISDTGDKEEKISVDYIFSANELETMLTKTGFRMLDIYSIPGKKLFTLGEPRAYIVAEKKTN